MLHTIFSLIYSKFVKSVGYSITLVIHIASVVQYNRPWLIGPLPSCIGKLSMLSKVVNLKKTSTKGRQPSHQMQKCIIKRLRCMPKHIQASDHVQVTWINWTSSIKIISYAQMLLTMHLSRYISDIHVYSYSPIGKITYR